MEKIKKLPDFKLKCNNNRPKLQEELLKCKPNSMLLKDLNTLLRLEDMLLIHNQYKTRVMDKECHLSSNSSQGNTHHKGNNQGNIHHMVNNNGANLKDMVNQVDMVANQDMANQEVMVSNQVVILNNNLDMVNSHMGNLVTVNNLKVMVGMVNNQHMVNLVDMVNHLNTVNNQVMVSSQHMDSNQDTVNNQGMDNLKDMGNNLPMEDTHNTKAINNNSKDSPIAITGMQCHGQLKTFTQVQKVSIAISAIETFL